MRRFPVHVHRCMTPLHRAAVLSGKTATAIKQLRVQYYSCRLFLNLRQFKEGTAPLPAYRCSESPSKSFQPRISKCCKTKTDRCGTFYRVFLQGSNGVAPFTQLCTATASLLAVFLSSHTNPFGFVDYFPAGRLDNHFYCRLELLLRFAVCEGQQSILQQVGVDCHFIVSWD